MMDSVGMRLSAAVVKASTDITAGKNSSGSGPATSSNSSVANEHDANEHHAVSAPVSDAADGHEELSSSSDDSGTQPTAEDGSSVRRSPLDQEAADTAADGQDEDDTGDIDETPGVAVRDDGDTRIVTINIHQAVPRSPELGDEHEDVEALYDVADYINTLDADVVMVQEVDDDKDRDGKEGVNHQADILFELLDADDMAFTPALQYGDDRENGDEYGTAIYTRNGYEITQAHNVDLNNPHQNEDRSVGIAEIESPDGAHFTVLNAHTSNNADDDGDQAAQIAQVANIVQTIQNNGGSLNYRDAITGERIQASGLPVDAMVVGGDFNAEPETVNAAMEEAHLSEDNFVPVNVLDSDWVADEVERIEDIDNFDDLVDAAENFSALQPTYAPNTNFDQWLGGFAGNFVRDTFTDAKRIDQLYTGPGVDVTGTYVGSVPADEVGDGPVTDHRPVILDVDLD